MDTEVQEDADVPFIQSKLKAVITWKNEMERHDSEVEALHQKLHEMKTAIHHSQDIAKDELEFLWRRVRTTATLLTYLKSKACLMSRTSADLSKDADVSSLENLNEKEHTQRHGLLDSNDGLYINQVLKSVQMAKDVMESLATRVLVEQTKVTMEKEKVSAGKEEIRKKSLQIELMSAKALEMEKFALGTNTILNEMRRKVEDLVEETSRQRLRAEENEQELSRVKRDFESLKSYVCSLLGVRENLIPSEESQSTENLLGTYVQLTLFLLFLWFRERERDTVMWIEREGRKRCWYRYREK